MDRTINTALLWTAPKWMSLLNKWIFMFNNFNLDNWQNIRVIQSNHDDIWAMDFETYKTPLEDGGGVLWKYYRTKTIQLTLSISADSSNSLNDLIDEIKYQTSKTEWKLRIIINWIIRERTATCTSLKFNRMNYNVNWVWNVVLTFQCTNPHSQLETPTATNIISQSGSFQSSVIYEWRADTYLKLYLSMDSGTSNWMSFTLNWYTITITATLNQWDIVILDGETKKATVNWTEVIYSWPFTPLSYWENIYQITNSGTYTWTLSYFTKFL